jgi:signal transduction histidine kinase
MTPTGQAFLGLTAIVAALSAIVTFALLKIMSAARDTRSHLRESGAETAMLSAALQEAVAKLKAQERAMAQRAEASERLSAEILTSLASGLLVVAIDGTVRAINPAGRRLLAVDVPAADGNYRALLGGAEPLAALIDECIRTGAPIVRRAIEMPRRAAGVSHLGVTVSPLSGEDGQTQGAICLFTDLTDVMALEEQLRIKDGLARVGELTAGIAHEFRNGLATIHGYSRLLHLDELPAAFRPYVEGIRAETESLREVVTNFLNFARPTQLTLTAVDLGAIAERAADDLRTEARARGGEITVSGEFPTVEGDEVLLRQALSNVVRNGVEAAVAAGVAPAVTISSSIDVPQGVAHIVIDDNGPGIKPEIRERIFQPFFTTKGHGTGLGLALVQKIVVTHNGRVAAGSAAAGGGRIAITLPLAAAATGFQNRYQR